MRGLPGGRGRVTAVTRDAAFVRARGQLEAGVTTETATVDAGSVAAWDRERDHERGEDRQWQPSTLQLMWIHRASS